MKVGHPPCQSMWGDCPRSRLSASTHLAGLDLSYRCWTFLVAALSSWASCSCLGHQMVHGRMAVSIPLWTRDSGSFLWCLNQLSSWALSPSYRYSYRCLELARTQQIWSYYLEQIAQCCSLITSWYLRGQSDCLLKKFLNSHYWAKECLPDSSILECFWGWSLA